MTNFHLAIWPTIECFVEETTRGAHGTFFCFSAEPRRGIDGLARTRANDYEDKQRYILDTAATVFAQLGMDKASMSEIARQGKISKALLYHYYSSKDALIFDIVRTHLEDLDAALVMADDAKLPAEQRLRRLVRQVIDNYEDADDKHKVQLNSVGTLGESYAEEIRSIERRITHRFSPLLQ